MKLYSILIKPLLIYILAMIPFLQTFKDLMIVVKFLSKDFLNNTLNTKLMSGLKKYSKNIRYLNLKQDPNKSF